MTRTPPPPPGPEDLARLYLDLRARLERLEGTVSQLCAERTRDGLLRPTWRDLEALRNDIARLERMLHSLDQPPPPSAPNAPKPAI